STETAIFILGRGFQQAAAKRPCSRASRLVPEQGLPDCVRSFSMAVLYQWAHGAEGKYAWLHTPQWNAQRDRLGRNAKRAFTARSNQVLGIAALELGRRGSAKRNYLDKLESEVSFHSRAGCP